MPRSDGPILPAVDAALAVGARGDRTASKSAATARIVVRRSLIADISTCESSAPSGSKVDNQVVNFSARTYPGATMALDPNRWTIKTQEAFTQAMEAARANANPEVTTDHLLAALLRQEDGVVLPILTRVGKQPLALRNATDEAVAKLPKAYGSD